MISHNVGKTKKSSSFLLPRENKENCHNNAQQPLPTLNKLGKLRESFALAHHKPQKIVSSIIIDSKEQRQIVDKHLKKQYTDLLKKDYSTEILSHLLSKQKCLIDVLQNHQITPALRAKMVDWMIEVMSSYKMSEECFFKSVRLMDKFFKNTTRKLVVTDLHLVGVVCMLTASKYEEIYPFKLNVVYDKICRKKFTKEEIIEMEEQLLGVLGFELEQVTPLDIINHLLSELQIPLPNKVNQYLNKVTIYLAKMVMHTHLAWHSNKLIAGAVIFIGLKTVEQVELSLDADSYMNKIGELCNLQVGQLLEGSHELLELAKIFHSRFPHLGNLKKFNNAQYEE